MCSGPGFVVEILSYYEVFMHPELRCCISVTNSFGGGSLVRPSGRTHFWKTHPTHKKLWIRFECQWFSLIGQLREIRLLVSEVPVHMRNPKSLAKRIQISYLVSRCTPKNKVGGGSKAKQGHPNTMPIYSNAMDRAGLNDIIIWLFFTCLVVFEQGK